MSPLPPGRFFIVEDGIFVALELEALRADGGYDICAIAADFEEAIAASSACSFSFVDVNLRDGSTGPRIARELWNRFGICSIFVAANPGQIGTGIAGALAYVLKPFDRAGIVAAAGWVAPRQGRPANDNVVLLPAPGASRICRDQPGSAGAAE